jgi:hypothetical protein
MSLVTRYRELPREIVDIICLFTGKFVFDKHRKLCSIVNLFDFENIKLHIDQFSIGHHHIHMNRQRLVRMLYTQKNGKMRDEKRMNEEVLLAQFADPTRHPLLFTKASPMEDVFVPLEKGVFCNTCKYKLSSVDLASPKPYIKKLSFFQHGMFHYYVYVDPQELRGRCKQCLKPVFEIKEKVVTRTITLKDYKKMNRQMANPSSSKLFNNRNMRVRHGVGRR